MLSTDRGRSCSYIYRNIPESIRSRDDTFRFFDPATGSQRLRTGQAGHAFGLLTLRLYLFSSVRISLYITSHSFSLPSKEKESKRKEDPINLRRERQRFPPLFFRNSSRSGGTQTTEKTVAPLTCRTTGSGFRVFLLVLSTFGLFFQMLIANCYVCILQ